MTAAGTDSPQLPPAAYARMAWLLRGGLIVAAVILAVSLADYLRRHPGASRTSILDTNPIRNYLTAPGLLSGIANGHAEAFLTVAILVLVATPILRVAAGAYYFRRIGDRPLERISLTVLLLLLIGIAILGPWLR